MIESFVVDVARTIDASVVSAMTRLLPQLSTSASIPNAETLQSIVNQECAMLLLARRGSVHGEIVGALTLVVFRIPTGVRAWIEDVVVDAEYRGNGIGESLTREALRHAAARGAQFVDLTSRPSRAAANRLYQRMGFTPRDTNCYRFTIERTAL